MTISNALYSSNSDEWETPQALFDALDAEFGFDMDVAASHENHKKDTYYTIEDDGLAQPWCHTNWCNPPYSQIALWVEKAALERLNGNTTVMLIPSRTDTKWFHAHIYQKQGVEIRFIKGRLRFSNSKNSAPFPSMIVIFRGAK